MFRSFRKSHRPILRYHETIGHLFTPNLTARLSSPKPGYLIKTNRQGFRSDWDFQEKKNSRPRILFFGDSNTAGDGVDNPMRFSDILGRKLNCETCNFGLSGSGTDQQLLIREELASPFEADLIVLAPFESNITRNTVSWRPAINRITGRMIKMPKPFFELNGRGLILHNQPVPKQREEIQGKTGDRPIQTLKKLILNHLPQARRAAAILTDRWNGYANPASPSWRLMRTIMERFIEQGPVPVMIMPLPSEIRFIDHRTPSYLKRFKEWQAEYGRFILVDILPAIRQIRPSQRARLRFSDDPHYNEAGHSLIAKTLIEPVKRLLRQT